jgi:hypothetical protein
MQIGITLRFALKSKYDYFAVLTINQPLDKSDLQNFKEPLYKQLTIFD